ncbi:RNA polymerase, sigma-24 subunit, ECF subfamily [Syntrophobotulus glycolicus DSM 8271]|uniref:RNA polymerase, sigma-24 subunit, ECF subfamily n=1 Tax=Syntrophobotulus glycolicus (strain DSM 8271 / FlGlyR) TaxID=645991 RepID=F0SXU3_SYNGF|nr:RNA polymerase, sigma-24 subunit, ECF subfamily [Syntrophobotulus glycolicus DSM 8271]
MEMDAAFTEIYEELLPVIYRFVAVRVPSCEVEDQTAEIIVKVWRAWPKFKGQSSLKTWALSIAYHQIADYYRHLKRMPSVIPLEGSNASDDGHSDHWLNMLSISQVLAGMTPQQAAVIQLRLAEGFSAVEAGRILGISSTAVDSILYRAKKSFRKLYLGATGGGKNA